MGGYVVPQAGSVVQDCGGVILLGRLIVGLVVIFILLLRRQDRQIREGFPVSDEVGALCGPRGAVEGDVEPCLRGVTASAGR